MYFAVIGDIMSNFAGLKSILDRLDEEGICRVIHTGNICAPRPDTGSCIALLRARQVLCVRGHQDKTFLKETRQRHRKGAAGKDASTQMHLDSTTLEYLNSLPRKRVLTEENLHIVVCHGAVNSGGTILDSDTPRAVFQRQREQEPADIIISGGSHAPFTCLVDGVLFVMPGTLLSDGGAPRYTLVNTEVLPPSAQTITL